MAIRITRDTALAERLARGLPLSVLGQLPLPSPLSRLLVLGRSDAPPDGRMALAAVLVPTGEGGTIALSPLGLGRHPGATRIPAEVAERFPTRPARGGFFVVDAEGADQLFVG